MPLRGGPGHSHSGSLYTSTGVPVPTQHGPGGAYRPPAYTPQAPPSPSGGSYLPAVRGIFPAQPPSGGGGPVPRLAMAAEGHQRQPPSLAAMLDELRAGGGAGQAVAVGPGYVANPFAVRY